MTTEPSRRTFKDGAAELRGAAAAPSLRKWVVGGGALAIVLGGFWFLTGRNEGTDARLVSNAAPVRVAIVQRRDMAVVERSLGTVVANTTVQLTARVQGTLMAADFQEGQLVKKGDLLFQIDPRPFEVALAEAQALYRRDQAQLKNAERDKQRYASLHDQGAISTQQRDSSDTNVEVLSATVAADKSAMDLAELNLSYTQIRSPLDGKTGPLLVQPGNMVMDSSTAPLVTIAQVRPVKVSFTLPQADLGRIQARQAKGVLVASLDVMDRGGKPMTSAVNFTSNIVNNQSGTIELRAQFDNASLALVPGELVNVTVQLNDIPGALVVPREAVNDSPSGSYIYVVAEGRAVERPVTLLFDDGTDAAISGNIAAGDAVISEGQLRVVPDGPVRVLGSVKGGAAPAKERRKQRAP